ncbi:hypothetical protein DEI92_15120 [Curtobacterium sp. MCBD17_034]|nr:hypothetical protein DEI92_15120 [Curtobacterium sp. MCBD17_034]PZM32875.1 hypothetical protein DEI90_15630 [Curtobacterium sp. MCBD17_031]
MVHRLGDLGPVDGVGSTVPAMTGPHDDDPTLVRNQPALTTSDGTIWVVVGAITAIVVGLVMWLMGLLVPAVGWTGLVLVLALFVAMLVVRFAVRHVRHRLATLAALEGAMVLVGLVVVLVVLVGQARAVG